MGGAAGEQQNHLTAHGSVVTDFVVQLEGMNASNFAQGSYSNSSIQATDASTEELVYEIGAISADVAGGGVRINIIPKQGGNRFSGSAFLNGAAESLAGQQLHRRDPRSGCDRHDAPAQGLGLELRFGGPIKQDKLWFFTAHRYWGVDRLLANTYYDQDPNDYVYIRDLARQGDNPEWNYNDDLRLTYAINDKNQVSAYYVYQNKEQRHWFNGPLTGPEAGWHYRIPLNYHGTATWAATVSPRLLFEAGFSTFGEDWTSISPPDSPVGENGYSVLDAITGERARTKSQQSRNATVLRVYKAASTYVTGSHKVKFGLVVNEGFERVTTWTYGDANLNITTTCTLRVEGVCQASTPTPLSITVYNTPWTRYDTLDHDLGLYAQDQWTLNRFTINAGLRFDWLKQSVPEQVAAAGTWVPERHFDPVDNVPNWKDLQPRLGINYDLFGNGKTAVKATLSRYVAQDAIGFSRRFNPLTTTVAAATRTWSDRDLGGASLPTNGDWIPQANELGAVTPSTFGTQVVSTHDRSGAEGRLARAAEELGGLARRAARNPAALVGGLHLLPSRLRQHRVHRQPRPRSRKLHAVLCHRASRSPPARWRRVSGVRPRRELRRAEQLRIDCRPCRPVEHLRRRGSQHQRATARGPVLPGRCQHRAHSAVRLRRAREPVARPGAHRPELHRHERQLRVQPAVPAWVAGCRLATRCRGKPSR